MSQQIFKEGDRVKVKGDTHDFTWIVREALGDGFYRLKHNRRSLYIFRIHESSIERFVKEKHA